MKGILKKEMGLSWLLSTYTFTAAGNTWCHDMLVRLEGSVMAITFVLWLSCIFESLCHVLV